MREGLLKVAQDPMRSQAVISKNVHVARSMPLVDSDSELAQQGAGK
jgi:hypothetical protein